MKLYKTYNCAGDLQGYFCTGLGDLTCEEYSSNKELHCHEICEGFNPQDPDCYLEHSNKEESLVQEQDEAAVSIPPLPPGYEDFLKNQEDSEV